MRKLLCAVLLVGLFVTSASAWTVGTLSRMNATEEEYSEQNPMAYASGAEGLIQSIVDSRVSVSKK